MACSRLYPRIPHLSNPYKTLCAGQLLHYVPVSNRLNYCQTSHYPPASRLFSTSTAAMADSFLASVKDRRTFYQLSAESPISDDRIHELIQEVVKHTPSSFNSQSTRVVVLLGDEHKKLWEEIVKPAVKAVAPPEAWEGSNKRLSGFAAAYGTVLFYEDPQVITGLQKNMALYAEKFPQWSEHTNAMHQYVAWVALEKEGFGANLQHYNPLIDQKISSTWDVPADWSLKAQLVFGKPTGQPGEKQFQPLEQRLHIYGGKFGGKK